MSEEYDVFADLYDNDEDDKAKFLKKLNSRKEDLLNVDSSDEDDLLPPSLRKKVRGKKADPATKKEVPLPQASSPNKKAKKSKTKSPEHSQPMLVEAQSTQSDVLLPTLSRCTRSRARSTPQDTTNSTAISSTATNSTATNSTATVASAPTRGRRGRRSTNRQTTNGSSLQNANSMSIADSLGVIAAMMNGRIRRNVMHARRTYLAEVAARSSNVDYVDLVSSPVPHIEGVVTVGSDDEDSKSRNSIGIISIETPNTSSAATLDCSFDEDNPEVSVKIKWDGGSPEIFKLRKHQKFQRIFSEIAERENTPIDVIVFNIDNRIIMPSDTPASINYKIYEFISGRVLTDLFDVGTVRKKRDANIITLKIQSDLWPKKPLKVELNKTDKLKILYIKCAEELKVPAEDIILSFNGDHLGFNDTPEDFELEGDEAIDLRIKKK